MKVTILAGGTGGAKLAAGMQELLGPGLSVIANTGDDIEALGVHVSPDPDLVTYWLSGEIDQERGWGIRGDSFIVFERLVELGAPDWFRLSDRDLATCLFRTQLLEEGATPTAAQGRIAAALGVRAAVLPMSDEPVRTRVRTPARWRGLQRFLIEDRAAPRIESVEFAGIEEATATSQVREALATADVIVIGPSNPVISIGPILALPDLKEAMREADAPVVAVSPFVAGRAVKGPTEGFMAAVGRSPSTRGIIELYEGVIDGIVIDTDDAYDPPSNVRSVRFPTLMVDARTRRAVAERTLDFARSFASGGA